MTQLISTLPARNINCCYSADLGGERRRSEPSYSRRYPFGGEPTEMWPCSRTCRRGARFINSRTPETLPVSHVNGDRVAAGISSDFTGEEERERGREPRDGGPAAKERHCRCTSLSARLPPGRSRVQVEISVERGRLRQTDAQLITCRFTGGHRR